MEIFKNEGCWEVATDLSFQGGVHRDGEVGIRISSNGDVAGITTGQQGNDWRWGNGTDGDGEILEKIILANDTDEKCIPSLRPDVVERVDINLVGANHRAPPDVVVTTDSNQSRVFVGDVDIWIALFPIFSWEGSSERERANEEKKYREEN
jgi:hypothetical protein